MNKVIKLLSVYITLALVLLMSAVAVDQLGNLTYAPQAGGDPNVCIVSETKMPVFNAGEDAVLEIPVRTASLYTASELVGTISADKDLPFEFRNLSPVSKPISVYYSIDTKITYDIYVPADIVPGVYPINISLNYNDMFSHNYSKNLVFYIKIENNSFDGSEYDYLNVVGCNVPENVERDSSFTAEIELENTSGIKINRVAVEIVLPGGINVSNDTAIKGSTFDKDSTAKFKYNLCSAKNMDGGSLPISFKISVFDTDNKTVIREFTYNTVVKVADDNYYYNPVLEITDITVPEEVLPGESFDVSVTYKNSGDCDLRYIRSSLTSETSATTFVNKTATSHLIQGLAKGESVTKTYTFLASDEIKSNFYNLEFKATAVYDVSPTEESEITASQYSGFYAVNDIGNIAPYYISEVNIPQSVFHGDEFEMSFDTVFNVFSRDVTVDVELPSGVVNTTPASFVYSTAEKGAVLNHKISLMCTENAADGFGTVKITVSAHEQKQLVQYTGVYINGKDSGKAGFAISNIEIPQSVDANDSQPFDLSFTVTSINNNAEDVVISVNLPSGIVNRTISRFFVGNLKKGESVTRTVTLYPTESVAEGFANIEISVSAKDTEATGLFTGIYVKNEEKSSDDMPVVIIDEYSYGNSYVLGGATFPLHIKFLNTSTTGSIKDLKITLVSDEAGVFTPAASSNTYFIQSLSPTQSEEWNLDIQTKSDIKPQSYGFIINISYKNEKGVEKTAVETLTIPVRQEMRFNISDIPVIHDISMNEDAVLSLNCANLGKSTVYNVLIKIQGNFMSTEYEIFAGNINAGSGYNKNVYLTPTMEGAQEGTVTFQYEDSDGVVTTVEKQIYFNAYSNDTGNMDVFMPGYDDFTAEEIPQEKGGFPLWGWIAIGVGAAVVIVVVIIIAAKKKKKDYDDED